MDQHSAAALSLLVIIVGTIIIAHQAQVLFASKSLSFVLTFCSLPFFILLLNYLLQSQTTSEDMYAAITSFFYLLLVFLILLKRKHMPAQIATPIAADILTRAKAPGNGFAFLMAGVATDYTEIMILKDTAKSWKLALFLPLITVPQVLLVAWLINIYG